MYDAILLIIIAYFYIRVRGAYVITSGLRPPSSVLRPLDGSVLDRAAYPVVFE